MTPTCEIIPGSCPSALWTVDDASVHCVVTSPPYYAVRDYGDAVTQDWPEVRYIPMLGLPEIAVPAMSCQLGHEPDVASYIGHLIACFRAIARVLREDGTCWVNIGDTYGGSGPRRLPRHQGTRGTSHYTGKAKDLQAIPERFALAMQAGGWLWRSKIVWNKPNALPESVLDRPAIDWEPVLLFSRSERYFYDPHGERTPSSPTTHARKAGKNALHGQAAIAPRGIKKAAAGEGPRHNDSFAPTVSDYVASRAMRTTWAIATEAYKEAHFATFPRAIARRCLLLGTSAHGCCPACGAPWKRQVEKIAAVHPTNPAITGYDWQTTGWVPTCQCPENVPVPCTVLDPFGGSGTTAGVAVAHGRSGIIVEPSESYRKLVASRVEYIAEKEK